MSKRTIISLHNSLTQRQGNCSLLPNPSLVLNSRRQVVDKGDHRYTNHVITYHNLHCIAFTSSLLCLTYRQLDVGTTNDPKELK